MDIEKPLNAWFMSSVSLLVTRNRHGRRCTRMCGWKFFWVEMKIRQCDAVRDDKQKRGKREKGTEMKNKNDFTNTTTAKLTAKDYFFLLSYNIRAISSRLRATTAVDVGVVTGCGKYHIRPSYTATVYIP